MTNLGKGRAGTAVGKQPQRRDKAESLQWAADRSAARVSPTLLSTLSPRAVVAGARQLCNSDLRPAPWAGGVLRAPEDGRGS